MAKDGTRRGGARAGAGRKPKTLINEIEKKYLLIGLYPKRYLENLLV